jgi:hypothetical protein
MDSFQSGFQNRGFIFRLKVRNKILFSVFLMLFTFFTVHPVSAQIIAVISPDDNANGTRDLGAAIAAVNAGTDTTIEFDLTSSTISLGSVGGGLTNVLFTNAVTFTYGSAFQPLLQQRGQANIQHFRFATLLRCPFFRGNSRPLCFCGLDNQSH